MVWKPDYITTEVLAEYQELDNVVRDPALLQTAVTAASRAVDGFCFRQFGSTEVAEPRFYTPEWRNSYGAWVIECDDFHVAPTEVAIDRLGDGSYSILATPGDVVPLDPNAPQKGEPWGRVLIRPGAGLGIAGRRLEARITAVWGWAAVPSTVVEATKIQANRVASRRESAFGVAGSPDSGTELRLLARLDPDVQVLLYTAGMRRLGRTG